MIICPRCQRNELKEDVGQNALSHRDNDTYICPPCGDEEGLLDFALSTLQDIQDVNLTEYNFVLGLLYGALDKIDELKKRDKFLSALESVGVDNWDGYSMAYNIFEERDPEDYGD